MFNTQNKKLKSEVALSAIMFCVATLCGCGGNSNFLSDEGFVPPNAPLLLNDTEGGLVSDVRYIVMNLTPAQAKALLLSFKKQKPSSYLAPPNNPKQMPPAWTPNALWKPQTVKKYWSGSFERGASSYPFQCFYTFDISKPATVVLYFYAVSEYN